MSIRTATLRDAEPICNLLDELGGYDNSREYLPGRIGHIMNHPDHYLLVYEVSGGLAGVASFHIVPELGLPSDTAILRYLVVSTRSRGQGIGKLLEERCVEIAKRRGCGRIQLHCADGRDRAHEFYKGQGYTESPKWFIKEFVTPDQQG